MGVIRHQCEAEGDHHAACSEGRLRDRENQERRGTLPQAQRPWKTLNVITPHKLAGTYGNL